MPTEVEWEAAARGKTARRFAYGDNFDKGQCNVFETHVRGTAPVGVFPCGATPEGLVDMTGNVWDWTSSLWGEDSDKPDYPYPYVIGDPARENPDAAPSIRRMVRGESWGLIQDLARAAACQGHIAGARAAYRNGLLPLRRSSLVGVRVVRSSSPISSRP